MKKLFTLFCAICFISTAFSQTVVWEENFDTASIEKGYEQPFPGVPYFVENITTTYPTTPWSVTNTGVVWKADSKFSVQPFGDDNAFEILNFTPNTTASGAIWQSELVSIPLAIDNYVASVVLYWDASMTSPDDFFEVTFTDGGQNFTVKKTGANLATETSPLKIMSNTYSSQDDLLITITAANNTAFSMYFDSVKIEEAVLEIPLTSIYDIQYTTIPGDQGTYPSLMVGNTVFVQGIVTGTNIGGFYIQQADGFDGEETNPFPVDNSAWTGIYVSNTVISPSIGDIVEVTGTVNESQGKTVLSTVGVNSADIIGSADALIPNMIYTPLVEKYESVLITARFYRVVQSDIDNAVYPDVASIIGIGEGATPSYNILVDDFLDDLIFFPSKKNLLYNYINGIGNYDAGTFRISPRDITDYQNTTVPVSTEKQFIETNQVKAIGQNIVLETAAASSASIYNLSGQLVKEVNITSGRTEIEMNAGVYVVKMNTGNDMITEKVLVK